MDDLEASTEASKEYVPGEIKRTMSGGSEVPPAEAGISLNWRMTDPEGCDVQFTMRGTFADDWKYVVSMRRDLVIAAKKNGWTAQGAQTTQPRPTEDPVSDAGPKQGQPKPSPKHTPVTGGGTQGGKAIQVFKADKVVIEPKPDGKVRVNFWQTGRKYADLYGTKSADKWADLFGWDESAFSEPETYGVSVEVGYTLSDKTNDKGNPYKDIEYIKEL